MRADRVGGRLRAARLGLLACVMLGPGCTTFAGAELRPDGEDATSAATAGSTSGAGGAGDGGGGPANDPDAYLPLLDAAELCALAAECPLFGASVAASLGLPIVGVSAADQRIELSYASCLGWLAAPIAAGRVGFAAQQELLYRVLPSGCAGGLELLPIEVFAADDARCDAGIGQRCDGDRLVDCDAGLAIACRAPPFSPATTCLETGEGRARCGIPTTCADAAAACDGTYAVTCVDDVLSAFDCASIGLGCSDAAPGVCGGESGAATCEGEAFGRQGCSADGERATLCLGGAVAETDCDAVGASCVDAGTTARCGDPAAEATGERCRPEDPGVDVCADETVLRTCVGGARIDLDCASFGRRCRPALTLGSLGLSARCAL